MNYASPGSRIRSFLREILLPAFAGCFRSRRDNGFLVLIVMAGLALRLISIDQPMRADEASTFTVYAHGSLAQALTYLSPNNHILHTLLVKATTFALGGAPAVIRLPALVFGCLNIVLVFCACRRLGSTGLAAALVLATSPYLILFSTNARGYTLLVCLVLVLIIVGDLLVRKPSPGATTFFALISALGMLTIPTMAFALAGIFLWMVWCTFSSAQVNARAVRLALVWCGVKCIALTLLMYAPTLWLSGLQALLRNEFVQSQDFRAFIGGLRWHVEGTAVQFARDTPPVTLAFLFIACAGGVLRGLRMADSRVVSLCVCLLAGAAALLLANHRIPFERTWIYLIPIVAILADAGLSLMGSWPNLIGRRILIAAFLVSLMLPALPVARGSVFTYDDTGLYQDGPVVGALLAKNMSEGDFLSVPCCQNYSVFYYLWRFGAPAYTYGPRADHGRAYYVVPDGVPPSEVIGEDPLAKPWQKAGSTTIFMLDTNAR